MILARLLTPADIGVFSITIVLLSFVTTFRDFGAGQYLVQEKELTPARIRAVWTLQLGIGVALAVLAGAASTPVSSFYGEPRMREIMWLLGLSYLVNPFGSLTYAWLMRTLRFEALAIMRFSGTLMGALVSVVLAWRGFGPISLAWGNLAMVVTNGAVSSFFRPPGFPLLPGLSEIRRVLAFGTRITSTSIIETLAQGAPELILGKFQSLTAVGLFSRANGLVALFARLVSDSVNSVALPLFAQQVRQKDDLSPVFLKANAYITSLGWSFALMVILLAHPLVRVLYGLQWDASVDLARWLAAAMGVAAPAALCYQALLGSGAAAQLLRAMAMSCALTVACAAVGAYFGLLPLAWGLLLAALMSTVVWLRITRALLGFDWSDYFRSLFGSAKVAAASACVPLALHLWFGATPLYSLPVLAVGVLGCAVGFVAGSIISGHPIATELLALWRRARSRFPGAKPGE